VANDDRKVILLAKNGVDTRISEQWIFEIFHNLSMNMARQKRNDTSFWIPQNTPPSRLWRCLTQPMPPSFSARELSTQLLETNGSQRWRSSKLPLKSEGKMQE
jgi:hypothetical protein